MDRNIPVPGRKPPVPLEYSLVTDDMKGFIKRHEGNIHHFYKDTRNNVTIGVGQMIPSLEAAKKLPLYKFDGDKPFRPALQEEIDDAWYRIKAKPHGFSMPASKFDPRNAATNLPNIGLRVPDREFMLEQRLREGIRYIQKLTPDYATFSPARRKVISDMEFNLGPKLNRQDWDRFFGAIDIGDWKRAGLESHRRGINEQRNEEARYLLESGGP